ncbi:MAG: response regulator [Planctomycetes bacterium]|nr:response regulator [Planctomycetota bacterium]
MTDLIPDAPERAVPRILIADDEATILETTADLLRQEGYACDCAADGGEARRLLETRRYSLLIADIKMPGNSDLELIRDLPEVARGMPAILQTGYPSITTAVRAVDLSVVAYLIKPVDFDKMLEAVRRAIGYAETLQTIEHSRARQAAALEQTGLLEECLQEQRGDHRVQPLQSFVDLTLANILGGLEDLKRLTGTGGVGIDPSAAEAFDGRNKLAAARDAIGEAVETLHRTRNSFKSKTLGALRVRLESLLADL